ncbi:MAG TPA: hypothetical protein VFI77_04840 [Gemmatimonadales bacterium]|nr:hypothetical protein [Gemmatimonadales bacterium]
MRTPAMILVAALALSASACGDDDNSEECPPPLPSIVGPDEVRPDLSLVPECKLPDPQTMAAPQVR